MDPQWWWPSTNLHNGFNIDGPNGRNCLIYECVGGAAVSGVSVKCLNPTTSPHSLTDPSLPACPPRDGALSTDRDNRGNTINHLIWQTNLFQFRLGHRGLCFELNYYMMGFGWPAVLKLIYLLANGNSFCHKLLTIWWNCNAQLFVQERTEKSFGSVCNAIVREKTFEKHNPHRSNIDP